MSLRHALLGLLAEEPASGYDLTRRFEELLGRVWPAKHPQIYQELGRLAGAGLIAVDSEGPRRRKVYRVTPEGLAEVRRWLADDDVDHTVRLEPLLRSFFLWLLPPEQARAHLLAEAAFFEEQARVLRAAAAAKDYDATPALQSVRVAIESGLRLYGALGGWAAWAATVPPAAKPVRDM